MVATLTTSVIVSRKNECPHLTRDTLLCTLREMRTRHFNCLIRGLRSPAQRAREADGWPAKVRKLGYWKGFSACKASMRWSPFDQAGETPRTCWQPGRSVVAVAVAVAERGPQSIRASRVEPKYELNTHLTGVWRSSAMTRTTRALPPVCFGIHLRS